MKKKLKQIADKFVKFIMLFAMIFSSLQEPIMVLAETTDAETPAVGSLKLGTDGPVSETGSVSTKATSSDGKVEVTKTVTADPDNLGKYHVEFEVKGKSTEEKNPVYVVIVFDRSGSMCGRSGSGPCTNQTKWDNAVAGAQSFASSVISSISTAKVALVTFASSASKDRSFSRNELATNLFGTPYGATNLHQGLIYANDYLSTAIPAADQERAKKFVVVMSDGQPTYYVNGWGNTAGNGDHVDAYVLNNTLPYADTLKTKASIYSIGYSLPTGKVYDNDYTYNGTTYHGLTAQQILSFIASPKTTGTGNNYYDAANESQIVGVFNQIATQIIAAGGSATLTDNLGGSFRVVGTENYGGIKKSDTIASITDSGYKFEFDIEIDPDTTTGWHNTNDGFKLEYTDAAGNAAEVIGTEDPYTYWVQKQYNYTVNYYKDSTSGELLATETRQAPKNTVINQDNVEKNKYLERAGEGYEFKNTSPTSIKIDGSGTQVINVIYGLEEFTYKVNYYYDDNLDNSQTIGPVTYGTEADPKDYYLADSDIRDGYKFDNKSDSAVITIKESGKEINIYYKKDNFEYNIYYFFNGTKNDTLTKTETPLFGTVVNASDNYLSESELSNNGYEDYFLNPVTPYDKASITVGSDTSKNYINIYYVSTDIEQEIEKTTSTELVDSLDDVVDYKVVYETTATNVEAGSVVTVTITDNLPFEIDTSKSNLSGGTYNNSNKTITWTFTETVSEFTENYTFNKTINYSVLYKDFADISSGSKKLINEAVGTVTIGDKTIDSESDTAEVPVEIYGTVIATYKTEDGTTLADNVPTTGLAGANYTTSSKTFSGYSLKSLPKNQNGKYVAEETIYVNYVYVKNAYAYTIDYHFNGTLDADLRNSGSALYEAVINASDNYLSNDVLSSHGYGNYFLHPVTPHNPDSITIGTDANSNHIDVYYVSTDIEQEIEKTTSTELVDSLDDVVDYKVVYETTATNVKANSKVTVTITDNLPFEIDTSKSNLNGGTYNNSNKTITWTFTETVNEFKDEYTFTKTINYSVLYKDFADISSGSKKLINEAVGTVTVGDTTIDSESDTAEVPVEIYGTVIATYKSEEGKELADNVPTTGLAGSDYKTSPKTFLGYSLKETPKNQNGKYVGEETIYVDYVYVKNAYAFTIDYHFNGTLDTDLRNSGSALYEAVINASDYTLSSDVLNSHGYGDYFLSPVNPFNPESITIGTDANSNHIDIYYINTEIDQEIEKTTSTELVDNVDDVVEYKVVYETTASNVKANSKVTVTITDNLPFEIDTSKSNLNGGTYNNSNKTITWTFTETVSEFTESYTFSKTINYSVVYKDFADISSGDKKLINEAVGTVTVGDKTIDSESDTAEVPVEIYGTVIATYKSDDDKVLADNVTKTGLAGSGYETEEKEFYGYSLKETPKNQKGKYVGDETIYVNYVYEKAIGYSEEELVKNGEGEVLSVDSPFNYTISYDTTIYDYVGEVEITIEDDPEFDIDVDKSIVPNDCQLSSDKIVCKYTKNITKEEDQHIVLNIDLTLYYKNIDKEEVVNNATAVVKYGTETKETDTEEVVIVPTGKVINKYVTEDGKELCDNVVTTGLVGTDYTTSSKTFDGYSLINVETTDENELGKYTEEDITITYIYSLVPEPPKTGYEGSTFNYLYFIFSLAIIYVIKRSI